MVDEWKEDGVGYGEFVMIFGGEWSDGIDDLSLFRTALISDSFILVLAHAEFKCQQSPFSSFDYYLFN